MNLCCACDTDFTSVAAFDAHRVGVHAYTYSEGLRQDPPVEDGRRCLDHDEMTTRFEVDGQGHWRLKLTDEKRESLARLKEGRTTATPDTGTTFDGPRRGVQTPPDGDSSSEAVS